MAPTDPADPGGKENTMNQMSTASTAPLDRLYQLAGDPRRDVSTLGVELLDLHRDLSHVHVARMDCGGISYSADEYLAVASGAREAARVVARAWLDRHSEPGLAMLDLIGGGAASDFDYTVGGDERVVLGDAELDRVAAELNDYYGLHVERLPLGGPALVSR